jgi:hypothetical protein
MTWKKEVRKEERNNLKRKKKTEEKEEEKIQYVKTDLTLLNTVWSPQLFIHCCFHKS